MAKPDYKQEGEGWVGELPEILTVNEAAQFLRETPSTVRRLLREKELKGFQIADRAPWKIRRSEMIDYVNEKYGEKK